MKLSVVIVNYNVKYFLEQALHAVRKATAHIESEVFVVDNHSVDGSCEMVRNKFPEVILIANTDNVGFSKANNQAIRQAKGEYVLLLNPDTVVQEDTFSKVIEFMDANPLSGSVGVKMIDGKGHFLPESKRGLPTPAVAFYKMFGLAALFPKSKRFGQYHLGYLDKNETHEVEVLAGAFMMLRKSALEKVGLLDEDYFMYGEDIDLSYRITQGGYKNYYYPHTTIIHYKGESTKRTSINYVFVFYKAMIVFAQKHYSTKHARLFSFLIHIAIYIRAAAAVIQRVIYNAYKPVTDFLLFFGGLFLIKEWYETQVNNTGGEFPIRFIVFNLLIYAVLWVSGLVLSGAYRKRRSIVTATKGIVLGTLLVAIYYAFIPESYRFSRIIVVLGSAWALFSAYASRLIGYLIKYKKLNVRLSLDLKTIIVGNTEEVARVKELLVRSKASCEYLGYVATDKVTSDSPDYIGQVSNLAEIVALFQAEEIIFCSKDISAHDIIKWMGAIPSRDVQFKIVPEESVFIIGSNSKDTQGDFYTLEINLSLNKPAELAKKRILDIAFSLLLIPFSPILILLMRHPINFLKNIFRVISGKCSWVGYAHTENSTLLPKIKKGVISPVDGYNKKGLNGLTVQKLNFLYAKDYSVEKDLQILIGALHRLDR